MSDYIASLFKCSVCFENLMEPPIMQCYNGHLICQVCFSNHINCTTCEVPLTDIRNLAMEKLAGLEIFPCKYASYGCSDKMMINEKFQHEMTCEFRPYMCPFSSTSCLWRGPLSLVREHVVSEHNGVFSWERRGNIVTDVRLPGVVIWSPLIMTFFGHHFIVIPQKRWEDGQEQITVKVLLIGSHIQAANFVYQVKIKHNERLLLWKAKTGFLYESESLIDESDCLTLGKCTTQNLMENHALNIAITIGLANSD